MTPIKFSINPFYIWATFLIFGMISCKSKKLSNCDAYGTINWDLNVDTLTILKDNVSIINKIPVNGAKSLHINTNDKGVYKILFQENGLIVLTKQIKIK